MMSFVYTNIENWYNVQSYCLLQCDWVLVETGIMLESN